MPSSTMTVERVRAFAEMWRQRLVTRHPGHPEQLSEEEFGQLVALNTLLEFLRNK